MPSEPFDPLGATIPEMQEAMAAFVELNTSRGSFSLKQRIGVNTGLGESRAARCMAFSSSRTLPGHA